MVLTQIDYDLLRFLRDREMFGKYSILKYDTTYHKRLDALEFEEFIECGMMKNMTAYKLLFKGHVALAAHEASCER
uniref:Uncharacterized protein n=1 Tax=viral metagenome TaxID=1070528 RepID=A0A6M3IMK7_9ZZZZ